MFRSFLAIRRLEQSGLQILKDVGYGSTCASTLVCCVAVTIPWTWFCDHAAQEEAGGFCDREAVRLVECFDEDLRASCLGYEDRFLA